MFVNSDNWNDFLGWVRSKKALAVDTETTGLHPFHDDRIAGISVGDGENGFYASFGHSIGMRHGPRRMRELLDALSDCPRLIMFNGTFDLHFLQRAGMRPLQMGQLEEVQVAGHLHNENDFNPYYGKSGLKELADKYLGPGASLEEGALREAVAERFGKAKARTKAWKGLMWQLPGELVEPYASADANLTFRLRNYFIDYIMRDGLGSLYREICDYTIVLQQMSYRGTQIDRPLCVSLFDETRSDAERFSEEFRTLIGMPDFNLNSSPQLHKLFGVESVTGQHLRQWMANENDPRVEMATALLAFRAADKMNGSYFGKYLPLLDSQSRLHCNFNVIGAETGRLSCSNPNLQAIPRDVENHKVKLLFTPSEEGGALVEMDLSQAEIRLASFYGREHLMAEHLRLGKDIHSETATLIGCDRSTAKRINFSAIYGIGAHSYSQKYEVPFEDALHNLEAYHATYPGFRQLYRTAEMVASRKRMLVLPTGRRRHYFLPAALLQDQQERQRVRAANMSLEMELRKASSNLVQGMVAAWMMKAMLRINREVPQMRMTLTVHDSLLFDIGPDVSLTGRDEMIAHVHSIMENPAPGESAFQLVGVEGYPDCPMKADVKIAEERWGTAVEWPRVA